MSVGLVIGFVLGVVLTGVVGAVIARRGLCKIHQAERRARRAERLAEVGSMTGGLAHEIRNPLSSIALNADLLREGIEDLDLPEQEAIRLRRRIMSLRRETERLGHILEDFLAYAGRLHIEVAQTDINGLVDELQDFFQPQAESQGVRLRTQLGDGGVWAQVDGSHLKQAILNLMLNAVQAMRGQEPAGELILRTLEEPDRHGVPSAVIEVIDTGAGMDQQTSERIFEPYFSTKAGGTGLGLSMARRIVEGHGGHLDLHTEPGKGTRFRVVIPIEHQGD